MRKGFEVGAIVRPIMFPSTQARFATVRAVIVEDLHDGVLGQAGIVICEPSRKVPPGTYEFGTRLFITSAAWEVACECS